MEQFSITDLSADVLNNAYRNLARALTLIENGLDGSAVLLRSLKPASVPVVGITGPPGAGKSTLVNALINQYTASGKRVAVLAVDPSSPFNFGSLLGDRVRMAEQFNKPGIYIRSVATRGSLGGLSEKTIEMSDLLRAVGFDLVFIETVGVGQSEVEVAGLADFTVVVLVPESGDDVQNIKSGIMEIADVFVVNKADRPGADQFMNGLKHMLSRNVVPVIATVASTGQGVDELFELIQQQGMAPSARRTRLLTEKAIKLIQRHRLRDINPERLSLELEDASGEAGFNLYRFLENKKYL